MTPEELEKLPKPLERTMSALELSIMEEIIERLKEAGKITPVIDWYLNRLDAIGESRKRVKELLSDGIQEAELKIDEIYEQAVQSDYVRNKQIYESVGRDHVPYQDNAWLQQIVEAAKQQTKNSLRPLENITQTTGFHVQMGRRKVFTPLSEYLERSLDRAMLGIATGAKTYSQAIGEVIDEMTASGFRVVDYASGKSDRIEVAARRAVMTGVAQMTDKVNEKNAEELGTDYWEVDWHMGARNTGTGYLNHQRWQGKVYSSEEMRTVCGLGEMLGFAGINCYHIRFPFIPGISKRKYTDEWLEEQNRKENQKRLFHGREYDTYGALQHQRRLERTIRKQKQDVQLLEKSGADPDKITAAKSRLRHTNKTYVEFSKEMGLRQQRERLKIGEEKPTKAFKHTVENQKRNVIMNSSDTKEVADVHTVGKIDREIYKCITNDIVTDEVVITDNQIQHILDRHPDAYETAMKEMRTAIESPDYIIADDKHKNTGLVIKKFKVKGDNLQLVLRVCTQEDEAGYKNSVISCWKISEKRLENYLKNKRILYKKE